MTNNRVIIARLSPKIIEAFIPLRTASAAQLLAEFFALFGWSTAGPVSDPWRFFGHELPVITRWCPSGPQLNQATLPVLIMEGEKSPALLRNIGQRLAAQLGNATLITLENQDNQALWSEPRLIAAEITAFIDETEAKTQGA